MSESPHNSIAAAAFAFFALQQELSLEEIAAGTEQGELASAEAHSPEWFAAAASRGASLLETAPELQIVEPGDATEGAVVAGLDLVRMYAPELAALEADSVEQQPQDTASAHVNFDHVSESDDGKVMGADQGSASVHIGLLRELEDFDT